MADTLLSFGKALLEALRPALAAAQDADDNAAKAQDSGATIMAAAPSPQPTAAAESISTPTEFECFDVVVPLEDIAADFIVEPKRYDSCLHPAEPWRRETPFSMKLLEVGESGELEEQISSGTLLSSALPMRAPPISAGLLPWEAFRVAWDDGEGQNMRVNPWELDVD